MRRKPLLALLAGLAVTATAPTATWAGGEIYGTILTEDGDTYTGPIRWDKNENFWDDMLDALKEREVEVRHERRDVRIFGIRVTKSGGVRHVRRRLSVPFGDLASIRPDGRKFSELTLRGGEVLRVRNSADIGPSMRGLVVDDRDLGRVELEWEAVARLDFEGNPGPGRDDRRLFGTVDTRSARFTGFIVWDKDESLLDDILDGDADGRRYKIPFRKIRSIRKQGKRQSEVTFAGGRTVLLRGTNDVDADNRGIVVTIPGVGYVEIDWHAFRGVTFSEAPASRTYDTFDGGDRIRGTVLTRDGRSLDGEITWDDDEQYTFEPLDGELRGVDFAIPFGGIASVTRVSRRGAAVTLANGDVLTLEGTNDVNKENKGLRVRTPDGEETRVDWMDVETVTFGR